MKSLLKFITCGSVDDGKSTLIGHILYDAKLLYADQEKALELDSKVGSREGAIDYSLLLDGLMAEREQGITIDVAYRYFTTDHRSFIVADTPGHEEYTRNMAVGASFADLAIILVDAKQGVLVQTKRHARICALMGISQFVFAINKMDLVSYSIERFEEIKEQIHTLEEELSLKNVALIPVSATEGDNVTVKSEHTPWYAGPSLLEYLEQVDVTKDEKEEGFYMPVQRVCRPNHTFRGFQGQIEAGEIKVGDTIHVLPSKEKATVKSLHIGFNSVETARQGDPLTIQLDKEIDVSRGNVISIESKLKTAKEFQATLLWMDEENLSGKKNFLLKLGTKLIPAIAEEIEYKIDVNTGEKQKVLSISKNEIFVCKIKASEEIVLDTFTHHKTLGEFILIDRVTNTTAACGVLNAVEEDSGKEHMSGFAYNNKIVEAALFEEFYYNMESLSIEKANPTKGIYEIGDAIPLKGDSYCYPSYFDIFVLSENVVVQIRDGKVKNIQDTDTYEYEGYPLINGRGFFLNAQSEEKVKQMLTEYQSSEDKATFFNTWADFEKYRTVIFHENYWII